MTFAQPHDGTPATADGKPLVFHLHRARVILQHGHDLDRWRDSTPLKAAEKRAFKAHKRAILVDKIRLEIGEYRDKLSAKFERYREAQLEAEALTPYDCGSPGSFAIPCSIVSCESGFDWGAYNPSGAVSVYQLLGKGAPFPVTSKADKLTHHRIAADLWAGGSGASHWAQCL